MTRCKKNSTRGGSGKYGNFAMNPTLYPSSASYIKGRGCPGTYNNVTAAGGKYSSKPYIPGPNMKGGKPVYCLSSDPIYKNAGGNQITPYGPHGGIYANVQSCSKGGSKRKGGTVASTLIERHGLNAVYKQRAHDAMKAGRVGPGWPGAAGGGRDAKARKTKKNKSRKTTGSRNRRRQRRGRHSSSRSTSRSSSYSSSLHSDDSDASLDLSIPDSRDGGGKRKTKGFKRGTKSKTHKGKNFETRKTSKYYRRKFRGLGARDLLAPDFPFVGGSGAGRGVKGYSSFNTSPKNVPTARGPSQAQPYSNEPISFGYSSGAPPNIGPNQSALANPSPHSAYMNCPKNNFVQPN